MFLLLLPPSIEAQVHVLTANYNNFRTNSNVSETVLNTSNVNEQDFGLLFRLPVNGQVYAQPLYASALVLPEKGERNVVFVATMQNDIYAFDVSGIPEVVWHVNLGPPVPAADFPAYTDIQPDVGILSTPAIDLQSRTLYAVAATKEGDEYHYRLHALDLATGQARDFGPADIVGSVPGAGSPDGIVVFDPFQHLQRPGLLVANGKVYVAFGSRGDLQPYHGWVFAFDASTLDRSAIFNVTPDGAAGAIWQSGHGLAADDDGSIYAISANGFWDGVRNFGQSFLKLSPVLELADWFTPDAYNITNEVDDDLGSTGAIVVPGTGLIAGGGKDGFLCVVDSRAMGRLELGNAQVRQRFPAVPASIFDLALWPRADGALIYAQGISEPMKAFRLVGGRFDETAVTTGTGWLDIPYQGMAISANGDDTTTGILWVTSTSGDSGWPGRLTAYDATNLKVELWNSDAKSEDQLGRFSKFVAPTVANGMVFVPTFSDSVAVYGLKGALLNEGRQAPTLRKRGE